MGCVGVILFINYTTADVKERAFVNAKQISGDPQTPSFASYSGKFNMRWECKLESFSTEHLLV